MWERIKNSRFAAHVSNSRAVYVTVLTLILALSVLITVTAISNRAKKKNNDTPDDKASQSENEQTEQDKDKDTQNATPPSSGPSAVLPNLDGADTPKPDDDSTAQGDNNTQHATADVPEMALPVVGSVSKGYDAAVQVYSATMGDYRIHLGLDMCTEENASVLAAADGVVSRIWDDSLMGKCVAVSHEGDCYTIYKNLDPSLPESVTVGTTVAAGDTLGYVGQSAILELAEEPHLHFEMTVGGLSVDPLEYFSEQAVAQLAGTGDTAEASAQPVE